MGSDTNAELGATIDQIRVSAKQAALNAALEGQPDTFSCDGMEIPDTFGDKWADRIWDIREALSEKYGDNLDALMRFSARRYRYACENAAALMRGFESSGSLRSGGDTSLYTATGYADSEGWAYTFYNSLSELSKPSKLLAGTPFQECPCLEDCLEAIAVRWFFQAAACHSNGSFIEAMDYLFEIADAINLSHGNGMWEAADDLRSKELSQAGKEGAVKRHAPMGELKAWTIDRYREGLWASPNAAAFELVSRVVAHGKTIGAHLSPSNAQRTIYDWLRKSV